ncbi:phosphatidylglycerol lysyltransferase domain-containing protein [Lachnospiraceae bacterium 45-W7]
MDISFQKIKLEDKERISAYLEKKVYRSCDLVFPNIYLWSRKYPTKYAVVEDTLIFQGIAENGAPSVTFPAGGQEQTRRALQALRQWFRERQMGFRMHLVQPKEFELLESWYPHTFQINYNRDIADYVYETEKLTSLAGKKLHGKRNHVNRFLENNPEWVYEPITPQNVEECFQMALKWREEMQCEIDVEKRDEMCVTLNALRLMEELELKGGLLRIRPQGEVIAFTIGEPLDKDTFVVHIEKAFAQIQGAYPMINQQFVLHEAQSYKYVNREEDTGAEGLRKAKLSYRPAFLVEKGVVTPASHSSMAELL